MYVANVATRRAWRGALLVIGIINERSKMGEETCSDERRQYCLLKANCRTLFIKTSIGTSVLMVSRDAGVSGVNVNVNSVINHPACQSSSIYQ